MHRALEILRAARFRPAQPCETVLAKVKAQHGLDLSHARARCGFSRGHLLDVVVYVPGGRGDQLEQAAASDLVEQSIGEEYFERWVGSVSTTPTVRGGPLRVLNANAEEQSAFSIQALPDAIAAAIAGLKQGLSTESLDRSAESESWVLFELSPEPAQDYAAQDDLLLASTCLPELKKCFLRGDNLFSGRFSGSGELFAYLKYESTAESIEARLAERAGIEDELCRALGPEQGALFGVGIGLRYVYVDLALKDPGCVEASILPALRARNLTRRAWLLFCDSELEHEWIGIYADTPPPFFAR